MLITVSFVLWKQRMNVSNHNARRGIFHRSEAWISNTIDWEYSSNLSLMSISSYVVRSTKKTGNIHYSNQVLFTSCLYFQTDQIGSCGPSLGPEYSKSSRSSLTASWSVSGSPGSLNRLNVSCQWPREASEMGMFDKVLSFGATNLCEHNNCRL